MSSAHKSKQQILDHMREAIRELGTPPGRDKFAIQCGVTPVEVKRYWPTHSELVEEAGAIPNEPPAEISLDVLFREYSRVCRHYGHIPSLAELRIATRDLGTRTHTVQSRFGGLASFNNNYMRWLSEAGREFADILGFPGWGRTPFHSRARAVVSAKEKNASARFPFLPVGLQSFLELASNRLPSDLAGDVPASSHFERKCADAFRALGFQVRPLGQGKGRMADCLALARAEQYAVVIDAKARTDGFVLGTEDRKLLEYAKKHSDELRGEGIARIYLCVVSSRFREKDIDALRYALTGQGLHGWSLWPAEVLMATVAESISERAKFRLADLENRFALNAIAT